MLNGKSVESVTIQTTTLTLISARTHACTLHISPETAVHILLGW